MDEYIGDFLSEKEDNVDLGEFNLDEVLEEFKPKAKKKEKDKEKYYINPKDFKTAIAEYYQTGICTNYLGECLNKIAEGLGYNSKFINYCVDEETEALTNRGWLKYNEITLQDTILSYDVESKSLEWSSILDIFTGEHNDLMFKLTNDGLDALVTPNHKFVSLEDGIKPIEEFNTNDHLVLMGDAIIEGLQEYIPAEFLGKKHCSFNEFLVDGKIQTVHYTGKIWCPMTEYGTWVCRRNGKVYVTGNSYKEDMIGDALIKMFSALKRKKFDVNGESSPFGYFTTIAFHAFINRIKREKKHHDAVTQYRDMKYEEIMSVTGSHVYVKPILDSTGDDMDDHHYDHSE